MALPEVSSFQLLLYFPLPFAAPVFADKDHFHSSFLFLQMRLLLIITIIRKLPFTSSFIYDYEYVGNGP